MLDSAKSNLGEEMKKFMIMVIFTTIALTGCASFVQTKKADTAKINTGISYYLPKREHRLVITAENLKLEDEEQKFNAAKQLFDEKDKLAKELESKSTRLISEANQTPVGKDGTDTKAKARAVEKAQTATGIALAARAVAEAANAASQNAKIRYEAAKAAAASIDPKECTYFVAMEITPQPLQPDTAYPFLLKLNSSPLRDEELIIKTTSSGLLTSADATSTDRTGDIAVEIAKAVAMFGIGIPSPDVMSPIMAKIKKEDEAKKINCYSVLKSDEIIDFSDLSVPTSDCKNLRPSEETVTNCKNGEQTKISQGKKIELVDSSGRIPDDNSSPQLRVHIKVQKPSNLGDIYKEQDLNETEGVPSILKGHYGILYRRDATYLIDLKDDNDDKFKNSPKLNRSITKQISMPNLSPVALLPYKYRPFVTTKNSSLFENGMLVSYDTNQPSSALGLAQLPAKVIEGYINALTNFLQLKIDYSTKEIAAIGKKKELDDLLKSVEDAGKK